MAEAAVGRSIIATKLPQSLINSYTKPSDAKLHFCCNDLIRRSRVSRKTLVASPQSSSSLFPFWSAPDYSIRLLGISTGTKGRMNGIRCAARRRISISTSSDGRWKGNWTSNFIFTLQELHLHDLAEQGQENTLVSIDLCVQKHAGFGFSVDGKITSSLPRKCICCGSSYITDVIYVRPGSEVDLDTLVLDTIRLAASIKGTCKESCDKIEPMIIQNWEEPRKVDKRWAKLLELRKGMHAG